MDVWSRGVHEKQIGTRLEYRSPEYLALEKAEKEWKASPRLVPTYFPRPSGDEREAQWMEWHGLEGRRATLGPRATGLGPRPMKRQLRIPAHKWLIGGSPRFL